MQKFFIKTAILCNLANGIIKCDQTGDVTIQVLDEKYFCEGVKLDDKSQKEPSEVLKMIKKICTNLKFDGNGKNFNYAIDKFFIKSIRENVDNPNSNIKFDGHKCNIDTDKHILIELIPKRYCIEFKYTGNKQLTTEIEDIILDNIVQGKTVKDIGIGGFLLAKSDNTKFGDFDIESSEVIGNNINLFAGGKCVIYIDSKKVNDDDSKNIVLKFTDDVKNELIQNLDFSEFENFEIGKNVNNSTKFKTIIEAFNKLKVGGITNFFKDSCSFNILKDEDNTTCLNKDSGDINFAGAKFLVLEGIKKGDINEIFFKKKFTINIDNSNDTSISIIPELRNCIEGAFKLLLENKVLITCEDIKDVLIKCKNLNSSFFENNPFDNYENFSIEGIGNLKDDTEIKNSDIKITIKINVFSKKSLDYSFNLKSNLNTLKKDGKYLTKSICDAIENIIKQINKSITKQDFVKNLNDNLKNILNPSNVIEVTDFDFSDCLRDENSDLINKGGTIKFTNNIINKFKQDCFNDKNKKSSQNDNSKKNTKNDKKRIYKCYQKKR